MRDLKLELEIGMAQIHGVTARSLKAAILQVFKTPEYIPVTNLELGDPNYQQSALFLATIDLAVFGALCELRRAAHQPVPQSLINLPPSVFEITHDTQEVRNERHEINAGPAIQTIKLEKTRILPNTVKIRFYAHNNDPRTCRPMAVMSFNSDGSFHESRYFNTAVTNLLGQDSQVLSDAGVVIHLCALFVGFILIDYEYRIGGEL